MKLSNCTQRLLRGAAIALVAAGAPALMAEGDFRFGAGLSVAGPIGDLSDFCEQGFGVSAFGEWGFAGSHALRGKAEYILFGETKVGRDHKSNANALFVMADYVYRFDSHDHGFYIFGGVGYVSGSATTNDRILGEWAKTTDSDGTFGYNAGFGCNFSKHFGVEATYVMAPEVFEKVDFNWAQVSLKYRF